MKRLVQNYSVRKEADKPFLQANQAGSTVYVQATKATHTWNGTSWDAASGGSLPYTSFTGKWAIQKVVLTDIDGALVIGDDYIIEYLDYEGVDVIIVGPLEIGKFYLIETLQAGDDFSNVGYVAEGETFKATGTTPTTWTNSTEVYTDVDDFRNVGFVDLGVQFTATGTTPTLWNYSDAVDITNSVNTLIELANDTTATVTTDYYYDTENFQTFPKLIFSGVSLGINNTMIVNGVIDSLPFTSYRASDTEVVSLVFQSNERTAVIEVKIYE